MRLYVLFLLLGQPIVVESRKLLIYDQQTYKLSYLARDRSNINHFNLLTYIHFAKLNQRKRDKNKGLLIFKRSKLGEIFEEEKIYIRLLLLPAF